MQRNGRVQSWGCPPWRQRGFPEAPLTFVVDVDGGIEAGTFVDGLTGVFNFRFIHGGVVGEYVVEEVFGINVVVLKGGVV